MCVCLHCTYTYTVPTVHYVVYTPQPTTHNPIMPNPNTHTHSSRLFWSLVLVGGVGVGDDVCDDGLGIVEMVEDKGTDRTGPL